MLRIFLNIIWLTFVGFPAIAQVKEEGNDTIFVKFKSESMEFDFESMKRLDSLAELLGRDKKLTVNIIYSSHDICCQCSTRRLIRIQALVRYLNRKGAADYQLPSLNIFQGQAEQIGLLVKASIFPEPYLVCKF